ncbi:MAG: hypothetical protein AAF533_21070 [Acidobacteriota bacterium]
MADQVRRIGLSLGADLCWPLWFEQVLDKLDLSLPIDGDSVRFEVERVTIEPYDLNQETNYDVVLDRLSHWMMTSREWVKKAILMDGVYVLNNPWSFQSMEKHTSYCAMMRLGLPVPKTLMVPPKDHEPSDDLRPTLERYAQMFDLGDLGRKVGFPLFIKPYDGGAWRGVTRIADESQLQESYDKSGQLVLHFQEAVEPFEHFVRCVGMGPQLRVMRYDPSKPHHDRYQVTRNFVSDEESRLIQDMTLTINGFFGWEFNSCEALLREGTWHPIDYANACPDSQVTSLHYHFPWLVLAKLRWALYCAATKRSMRLNLDWQPYFDVVDAEPDLPLKERLSRFADITRQRFDAEPFAEFCEEHLGHLPEVAREFVSSDAARDAIRQKVASLFPEHEVDEYTELFCGRVASWLAEEGPEKMEP